MQGVDQRKVFTHFATNIFSETVAIFVKAQPQGTENGS